MDSPILTALLLLTLKGYFRSHGRRILSLAKLLGQESVEVESRALYRYYDASPPYPQRLEDLLGLILSSDSVLKELREWGVEVGEGPRGRFLRVKLKLIEELLEES